MPRTIELTLPSDRSDRFVEQLRDRDRVLSIRLLRGISVEPEGDVVSFEVLDDDFPHLMHLIDGMGLGTDPDVSMSTSTPESIASVDATRRVARDRSTGTWEELQLTMGRESAMTRPKLVVMAFSGLFAAAGLHTGSLHLIIGAMLVAPAYVPLAQIAFGLLNRGSNVRSALYDMVAAYAALMAGAAVFVAVNAVLGSTLLGSSSDTYLSSQVLETYWTTTGWADVVIALAGGAAGALLIVTNRRVLATGVVIALALVPSLALAVMEVANGDVDLAARATGRWAVDVVLVLAGCSLVFAIKRRTDARTISGRT